MELAAALAERAELEEWSEALQLDVSRLEALNAELVNALERFTDYHYEECSGLAECAPRPCICGVNEARAVLKKAVDA